MARLEADLSETGSDTVAPPPLERYITATLTEHLRHDALYATERSGGAIGSNILNRIAALTPANAAASSGAEEYLQERRIEADRFILYLHKRSILP
jgi:hypothetical protein